MRDVHCVCVCVFACAPPYVVTNAPNLCVRVLHVLWFLVAVICSNLPDAGDCCVLCMRVLFQRQEGMLAVWCGTTAAAVRRGYMSIVTERKEPGSTRPPASTRT